MVEAIALSFADRDTAARTISGEADDQGREGKIAVAWVIRNRKAWIPNAWWGSDVGKVCTLHAQFSCWLPSPDLDRIKALAATDHCYRESREILDAVMAGTIPDPTRGCTTYKVRGTLASWDHAVEGFAPIEIGQHDFWRLAPNGICMAPEGLGGTNGVSNG